MSDSPLADFAKQLTEIQRIAQNTIEHVNLKLDPVWLDQLQQRATEVQEQFANILQATVLPASRTIEQLEGFARWQQLYAREAERLAKELVDWAKDNERFIAVMASMGWPPPMHIPVRLVRTVAQLEKQGRLDSEELETALLDFYDKEQLNEILNGWKKRKFLEPRLRYLKAAMEAHINGCYELSIPGLLPHVDGIVATAFGHEGQLWGSALEGYVDNLLKDDRPGSFREATRRFFLDSARQPAEFGGPIPEISRHAILHGIDTNYASESKSLRVLLLFDTVQESIRYIATKMGKKYHRPSCSYLGPPKRGNRIVFVSRHHAVLAGLHECRRCFGD